MTTINGNFNMSACREFTVEAGRPDTITAEKFIYGKVFIDNIQRKIYQSFLYGFLSGPSFN